MILEKIPEIQQLSPEQKLILAEELWADVDKAELDIPVPEDHVKIVEERWTDYLENPGSASSWEDVRKRLLARNSDD